MKFRVSLSMIFDDEETARLVFEAAKKFRDRTRTIRKGEPAEERSTITLERHYHDEDTARPCEVIEEILSE